MNVKNTLGAIEAREKQIPIILPHQWVEALEENWKAFGNKQDFSPPDAPIPWMLHGDSAPYCRSGLHAGGQLEVCNNICDYTAK